MTLRAVAFGDIGLGRWGTVLSPGRELPSFAVLGPEPAVVSPAAVEGDSSPRAEWWVTGEGLELAIAPGEGVNASLIGGNATGFDQLVTVRGEHPGDGGREVDLLGSRSERADLEAGGFQLLRDVRAWFSPKEGLALVAVRPRRAAGHGDERVDATIFEAGQALTVAEPRLSTAYTDEGLPARATLELWLPDSEEDQDQPGGDEAVRYPRRAAGEAAGSGVTRDIGPLTVQARPFRWRAAGREGTGVYLLARAQ